MADLFTALPNALVYAKCAGVPVTVGFQIPPNASVEPDTTQVEYFPNSVILFDKSGKRRQTKWLPWGSLCRGLELGQLDLFL